VEPAYNSSGGLCSSWDPLEATCVCTMRLFGWAAGVILAQRFPWHHLDEVCHPIPPRLVHNGLAAIVSRAGTRTGHTSTGCMDFPLWYFCNYGGCIGPSTRLWSGRAHGDSTSPRDSLPTKDNDNSDARCHKIFTK
jgi:hypothetical protein